MNSKHHLLAIFFSFIYHISMRVIAGKYRGKKLKDFDLETTKPTLDRVKESMFNLIQFDVVDAHVLDLFSGTGALGVEALSRGATSCVFIDVNTQAMELIKANSKDIEGEKTYLKTDYLDYLNNCCDKFDIILLDPPYMTDYGLQAIDIIVNKGILNQGGILLFETTDETNYEFAYYGYVCKRKKYGTVAVYKIQKVDED